MPRSTAPGDDLTPAERDRLSALRSVGSLSELRGLVAADDEHAAYFDGKREWRRLRAKELDATPPGEADALPGNVVLVDGRRFHVHGVTHADTDEERAYLREHVARFLDDGASVYVEQGIRPMYFDDVDAVCEMDDYTWAMDRCQQLGLDSALDSPPDFDGIDEELDSLTDQFRDAVFSLIADADADYGDDLRSTLGDVASDFLTSDETMATAEDYASFSLARSAARDPRKLGALQRYYETAFLPQPVEREWLKRHDPELELVTHARNERQADYVVYHNDDATDVHLVVGAAHQPGVTYYLQRHAAGDRSAADYEPVR